MRSSGRSFWKICRTGLGLAKIIENTGWRLTRAQVPRNNLLGLPIERQFMRHGERSGQWRKASVAQSVVLSEWHAVQGLGILYLSVIAGVMKSKVCARTKTPGMVTSIFGMWQATHWLPVEPAL